MNAFVNCVVKLAIQIQQIPAPTFHEEQRAQFIHQLFVNEGLQDICIDETGNVFARLPGRDARKTADCQCAHGYRLSIRDRPGRRMGAGIDPWARAWR